MVLADFLSNHLKSEGGLWILYYMFLGVFLEVKICLTFLPDLTFHMQRTASSVVTMQYPDLYAFSLTQRRILENI